MCGEVVGVGGCPGSPHLDAAFWGAAGHRSEGFGGDLGDGAAESVAIGVTVVQRFIQPGPADFGEDRIGGDLEIDIRIDVGDDPGGAFPRGLADRIVQDDQTPGGDHIPIRPVFDFDGLGVSERCQARGCRSLADEELRSIAQLAHGIQRSCEPARHWLRLVLGHPATIEACDGKVR